MKDEIVRRINDMLLKSQQSAMIQGGVTTEEKLSTNIKAMPWKRITEAYKQAIESFEDTGDSIWNNIPAFGQVVHTAIIKDNFDILDKVYSKPFDGDVYQGFDAVLANQIKRSKSEQKRLAGLVYKGLHRLTEAMGVVKVDNPERYYQIRSTIEVEELLTRIENKLGWRVEFPNPYPNEYGLWTERGVASFRAVQALYQAWRIKKELGGKAWTGVMEIGAGLGRTAYYANKLGLKDYTIIDLPLVNVSQAHFLMSILRPGVVGLYNENIEGKEIRILPAQAFEQEVKKGRNYDLVLNTDSLTEMDKEVAIKYWQGIKQIAKVFVSINHEGNKFSVRDIMAGDKDVDSYIRYPYWMRTGYVEEIVRFKEKDYL